MNIEGNSKISDLKKKLYEKESLISLRNNKEDELNKKKCELGQLKIGLEKTEKDIARLEIVIKVGK